MTKPLILPFLLLGLAGAHAPSAATDRARALTDAGLAATVANFAEVDGDTAPLRKAGLTDVLRRLAARQAHVPRTSHLYEDISYTLAYFHRDYAANIGRLLAPVRLWQKDRSSYSARYGRVWAPKGFDQSQPAVGGANPHLSDPGGADPLVDVPPMLRDLYWHGHDTALLGVLLSLWMDGGPAEVLSGIRMDLLMKHPAATLGAMASSRLRLSNVADDFLLLDRQEYAHAVSRVQRAGRHGNARVRGAARQLLERLAADRSVERRRERGRAQPRHARPTSSAQRPQNRGR